MLGMIGALIFGVVYAGAWMADEDREQVARKRAKETPNYPYYWDKNGKLRNAYTGRKYSTEDARREIERKKNERENQYGEKYWGFRRYELDKYNLFKDNPILELYDDYDDYCKSRAEMEKKYNEKGVDFLYMEKMCDGFKINHRYSNRDIESEKSFGAIPHYNFKEE